MERVFKSRKEFEEFAKEFVDYALKNRKPNEAFFLRLRGDLGAGKTTFAQAIGKVLGVTENMQSPTFVLEKFYMTRHDVFKKLIHIDVYRVEKIDEAKILALDELQKDPNTLVLIEWPERIERLIPKIGAEFLIDYIDHTTRKVTLEMYGKK